LRGYSALALVRQAQGDLQGAQDLLQRAEEIAIRFDAMEVDDISVARQQAELSIAAGNLHGAWLWAEARGLKQDAGLAELDIKACRDSFIHGYSREMEYATLARLLIAQALASPKRSPARNDEAPSRLLERLCHMAERQGHSWQLIELLVIQAVALRVRGDTANAMRSLERALHLAEPENIVRVFVAEGDRLGGLLRQAAAGSIEPAYARKLLGEFETAASGPVAVERPPPCPATLIEPLSKREVEVLRLLTTHLSSTEIADHLVISVNTVRSHIKNIYGKLDVHARSDAVQLGQELNLV
jgi:LuxR family maltose regulon positive regulatory protein